MVLSGITIQHKKTKEKQFGQIDRHYVDDLIQCIPKIKDCETILKNLCDRIYLMEEGTISKSGNHHVLLKTANLYSNYWKDIMADANDKAPQLRGFINSM